MKKEIWLWFAFEKYRFSIERQGMSKNIKPKFITVDSRLLEPALIRIIRVRWRSPWIYLPNSGKNTLSYSNFSSSNFQLFEAISITLGANYRLYQPQLFEFVLFGVG